MSGNGLECHGNGIHYTVAMACGLGCGWGCVPAFTSPPNLCSFINLPRWKSLAFADAAVTSEVKYNFWKIRISKTKKQLKK